jgi:hypothetical protein
VCVAERVDRAAGREEAVFVERAGRREAIPRVGERLQGEREFSHFGKRKTS